MDVLFLCTANICRSPMAEVLFRSHAASAGAPPDLRVHSAGLLEGGWPASEDGVTAMRERGLDTSGHQSRQMTAALIAGADVVIGMAREHVREAVLVAPDRFFRMYTLKELVRRATETGPRPPDQPLAEWLEKVHAGRTHADLLGRSPEDDIADPIGRSRAHYQRTADEIDSLAAALAALIWPAAD